MKVSRFTLAIVLALLVAFAMPRKAEAVWHPYAGGCDEVCMNTFGHDAWLFITCYSGQWLGCFRS